MISMKIYAHNMRTAAYQRFIDASLTEWWAFSQQFEYAQVWASAGVFTPAEAKEWAGVVEGQVTTAIGFKANGFTPETAAPWYRNTIFTPAQCAEYARQGRAPRTITQPRPQRTR